MIAIKLIFQSLGVFAVGGTVITGAAYKINNDIAVEKISDNEAKKAASITALELAVINLTEAKKQISQKNFEKTTINNAITQLRKEIVTLEKDIKDSVAKIIEIDLVIKTKTNLVNKDKQDEDSKKETLRTKKEDFDKKTQLLTDAKEKLSEETSLVATSLKEKEVKEQEKTSTETTKNANIKTLSDLGEELAKQKISQEQSKQAHNLEKAKPQISSFSYKQTNNDDDDDEVANAVVLNCKNTQGLYLVSDNCQDKKKITELEKKEKDASSIVYSTQESIIATTATVKTSSEDALKAATYAETAHKNWTNATAKKDLADKAEKEAQKQLIEVTEPYKKAKKESEDANKKHKASKKDLTKEESKKKDINETLKTKNQLLKEKPPLLKTKEQELLHLQQEITQLTQDIESLTSKTTEN